uniref:Uncharacterized protein n=1 Tax=Megaselia scalaris TaxID=36166 RepID=T1H4G7_MEGSC
MKDDLLLERSLIFKFENIGTDNMIADNLTKAVVKPKHQFCCKEM